MTINEMKDILAQKLKDENCYFSKSDLSIEKGTKDITISIKGTEPFSFIMTFEHDEYFGYITCVHRYFNGKRDMTISFIESKQGYDVKQALIEIGYHIGTQF